MKSNNLLNLFLGIIFCVSIASLIIACLAFTKQASLDISTGSIPTQTSLSKLIKKELEKQQLKLLQTYNGIEKLSEDDLSSIKNKGLNEILQAVRSNPDFANLTLEQLVNYMKGMFGGDSIAQTGKNTCLDTACCATAAVCVTSPWCLGTCISGCCPTGERGLSCIANSQLVNTKNKGIITLKDLKPGDYVHNGEYYDLVYYIQEHEGKFEVLNIQLKDGVIKLTSKHLVYLDNQMVQAGSLNIGDIIQGKLIKNITKTVEKVRNPVTTSGKLLLGGIVASCHNHSEEHANKLQKIADSFDFEKLTDQIGSNMVQELVNTMYNKLANKTFRKDRIIKPLSNTITV